MFYLLAAFCAGPIILYCYGKLLPAFVYIFFSVCCLFLVKHRSFLPILCFVAACLVAQYAVTMQSQAQLKGAQEHKEVQVAAYLCSIPRNYLQYSKADFCLLEAKDLPVGEGKLSLTWPSSMSLDPSVAYFRLKVSLVPPRSAQNFVGGSFEKYLFYQRVVAKGQILEVVDERVSDKQANYLARIFQSLNHYRIGLNAYLDKYLSKLTHGGLSRALLLGERGHISAEEANILRYTGTQHLLAISGLHVGLIMLALYRLTPAGIWRVPFVAGLGFVYVLMVGASESALRAWVMIVLVLLFLSGRWKRNLSAGYVLALFVVLIIDPLSPMNLGVWYSFLCVALLLMVFRFHASLGSDLSSLLLIQFVLVLGMAPIHAVNGSVQGFSSLFGNVIAVPWVSFIILPLNLVAMLVSLVNESLGTIFFSIADICLQILMQYLASISDLFAQFRFGSRLLVLICYSLVCLAAIVLIRFSILKFLLMLTLFTILYFPLVRDKSSFEVLVFDAGQGLSMAMNWQDQYWLYDTGLSSGHYSLVESAVFPYFRSREMLYNLTGLVVSHGDADHAGGAARVDAYLGPRYLWAGEPGRLQGLSSKTLCHTGLRWQEGEGVVEVVYPFSEANAQGLTSNNQSCVLRFRYRSIVFLVMGDLEGEAEMALVEKYGSQLRADVLIAGHHGSNNASSYALLKHVRPQYFVASAGYLNRFGHPHPDVVERAESMGAEVLDTSKLGALRFKLEEEKLRVEFAREMLANFWMSRPENIQMR